MLIRLMLGHDSSMGINEQVCFWALVPLPLVACVKSTAVDTSVQHVVLLLKKEFKFFHVELTHQFIFFIHYIIQVIERYFASKSFY